MKLSRLSLALAASLTAATLGLTACTGTENTGPSVNAEGNIAELNFGGFGGGAAPKPNYNPYLDATKLAATTYLFEPLFVTEGYSCEEIPWLATEYEWTDAKTLVFTLRDGVKWTDGETFTADDVAFSFNLLKEYEVLDTGGVWQTGLKSVTADAENQVTLTFDGPGASAFPTVSAMSIVPEHVWSKVDDPTTFTNAENPVGTGSMVVKSMNPQELVIERNPDYWQADKIKVQEIHFHTPGDSQVEQLKLSRGFYDTNGMFVQDIQKSYVDRDPENHHYWYSPGGVIAAYMNLKKAPFDDVNFRRALLTAFDHDQIVEKAQLGYVEQASQTSLVIPGQEAWLPTDVENEGKMEFDLDAADQALTDAGYELDSEGRRLGLDGQPISFTFTVPGEWLDWVAASNILIENLGELGIQVEQETPTPEAHDEARSTGDYDMIFGVYGGGCNMYRNFADPFDSTRTAPIGEPALTNEIRWEDPETDALLQQLKVAADPDDQKAAVAGLAEIMMDEVPTIPLWYGAKWFQYSTENAVGWPNEEDPYAGPENMTVILTHLRPAQEG